ncbi:hypothetical protein [Chryseobacterium sp. PCH239]|uniref:hypothetical protein n=1 Tax=Chryseobacterium sp. PCH239 TaxID=2825845 RepID=UPI00209EF3D4|nr:hypothetical protein [Chryseobacterium sp. PCH239]
MHTRIVFNFLAVFAYCLFSAQTYEIQYTGSYNGKVSTDQPSTIIWVNEKENFILNSTIKEQKSSYPYEITKVEKPSNSIVSYAFLKPGSIISASDTESVGKQNFELTNETKRS